jgi:hypothetical protein
VPIRLPSNDTKLALAAAAATVGAIAWILWPLLSETFHGHTESKREVRDFVGRLQFGATREAVEGTHAVPGYRKLIVRERGATTWRIGTPGTLGATDWTLTLRFGDQGLSCVVVGTADDWSRAPAGAPPAPCAR